MAHLQHPHVICEEHVRSQLLDRIPSDAAYQMQPKVSEWVMEDEQGGPLKLCVEIGCERSKFARMILKVASDIEYSMSEQLQMLFKVPVEFRLDVRFRGKSVEIDSVEILPKEATE